MIDAPFGTWESPITAEMLTSKTIAFQDLVLDEEDIYWSEMRPQEGGRYVIVKYHADGKAEDLLPEAYNARTRVHEYGGAAFTVHQGIIYFVNYKDQRLYKILPHQKPEPITEEGIRFADLHVTPEGIVAVAESHQTEGEPQNFIALIDTNTGQVSKLHAGYDFYAHIALSEDNHNITWICWNHPNMPWNDNELWTAEFSNNAFSHMKRIDPTYAHQSFFQPQWRKDNTLFVVTDKSNWWNLYAVRGTELISVFTVESELGLPLWVFNMSTWGFYQDKVYSIFSDEGLRLWEYDGRRLKALPLPYTSFSKLRTNQHQMAMIVSSADQPAKILKLDEDLKPTILKESTTLTIDPAYLSFPEHIQFPTSNHRVAYAYYYPPKNKNYQGLPGTLPPLIVNSHGGPTARASSNLNLETQYWTSRGFAVVDVNYAGSTGYGRDYRNSLEGNWGVYDVADCVAAAEFLSAEGKVDRNKLAITGGSAGGYTTLAALTFTDTFHVGASHYGVSDIEALAQDTHKFESKYMDRLIGPYPKERQTFLDRSPIHHVDQLSCPVIFFQGEEDKIVPPNQAEKMFLALKEKGVETQYLLYPGEQHGFRIAKNIITTIEEQRMFFVKVLELDQS